MFTEVDYYVASAVISIRVDEGLKRELEELGIDYADLVRRCLEEVVRREKLKREIERADRIREGLLRVHGVFPSLAELVREDRDDC